MSWARSDAGHPHRHVTADDLLQEGLPYPLVGGRVLVGKPEELDPVFAVQELHLIDEAGHVAVPPSLPERPLPAIRTAVRAAAGKLHDRRAADAECLVLVPDRK